MQTNFIGVDVAMAELIISLGEQTPVAVKNDAAAIGDWLARVPKHSCIAMESTGCYHQ